MDFNMEKVTNMINDLGIDYKLATLYFVVSVALFEGYLAFRQHQRFKDSQRPKPIQAIVTQEEFTKAQAYGLDKSSFGFLSQTKALMETVVWLRLSFYPLMWAKAGEWTAHFGYTSEYEITQACMFLVLTSIIDTFLSLPFDYYFTFVIEERHGFNKQTQRLFFVDLLKKTALSALIGLPLMAAFLWVIQWGGDHFYIYLWVFMFVVQLIAVSIYPTWIQPCFNDVKPLPEGSLRSKIEKLAAKIDFPLSQLYEIDGSKRSGHSNAYFYGFFKNKRIVLFDTLIQQSTEEEVVAVLGHELGHWKLNHTIKLLVLGQFQTLIVFFLFGCMINNQAIYASFGFPHSRPKMIGLILFGFIFAPVQHVIGFLMNILSRKHEFEADAFAVNLGYGPELKTGLIKLQKENLGAMNPDPWYTTYHYSHPPLVERLAAIEKGTKKSK